MQKKKTGKQENKNYANQSTDTKTILTKMSSFNDWFSIVKSSNISGIKVPEGEGRFWHGEKY